MKVVRFHGPGDVRVEEAPEPTPAQVGRAQTDLLQQFHR